MGKWSLLLLQLFFSLLSEAQTVGTILDDGIPIKKGEKVFLIRANESELKYEVGNVTSNDFQPYKDSTIFLVRRNGINVHLPPLNPLRYSFNNTVKFTPDPIYEEADKAFVSISSLLTKVSGKDAGVTAGGSGANKNAKPGQKSSVVCECPICDLGDIRDDLEGVKGLLALDPKTRINNEFLRLRNLTFENEESTRKAVNSSTDTLNEYRKYFKSLDSSIAELEKEINAFKCQRNDSMIAKYVLIEILTDVRSSYNTKFSRFKNLEQAFKLVDDAYKQYSQPKKGGENWYAEPINVPVDKRQISLFSVTLNNSGLELKNDEIANSETKEAFKKVLRFRKYQTFIPEVSAGVAYTLLEFPQYGISRNKITNEDTVAVSGQEKFRRLNFTAMINWVLYSRSDIHPFLQLGVGANTDYPTLFLGVGGRFNIAGRTLGISVGGASSWIKSLNKLSIGSIVDGTNELEQDITHEFKKPQLYFGIQHNF